MRLARHDLITSHLTAIRLGITIIFVTELEPGWAQEDLALWWLHRADKRGFNDNSELSSRNCDCWLCIKWPATPKYPKQIWQLGPHISLRISFTSLAASMPQLLRPVPYVPRDSPREAGKCWYRTGPSGCGVEKEAGLRYPSSLQCHKAPALRRKLLPRYVFIPITLVESCS